MTLVPSLLNRDNSIFESTTNVYIVTKETMAGRLVWLLLLVSAVLGLAAGQLNGYINPLWMTDRRGRGRSIGARDYLFTSSGLSSYRSDDPRSPTSLVYLDENGRYRPVYRQDRVFRADQNYYRVNEPDQYLPTVQTSQGGSLAGVPPILSPV